MERNEITDSTKSSEDRGSNNQELKRQSCQPFGVDGTAKLETKCSNDQVNAGPVSGTEDERMNVSEVVIESRDVQIGASSLDGADDKRKSLSVVGKESSDAVPSVPQRGLDHCISAPVGTHGNLFSESHEQYFSRSFAEKREKTRTDLKLDRMSEHEKQKFIASFVKVQRDGTLEVDLTNNDFIPTELNKSVPRLKIAILVVGTRGDVQPLLAVAKRLQDYGHHIRLATHNSFFSFVKSAGIDFYPLAGDPRDLAGYMARNKGLFPSTPGEIPVQRKRMRVIIESLLPACTEPDKETGEPFRAQAIIANAVAYGHTHVAEALGVPLHIFFTMPWTPTSEFPHPMARVFQKTGYWLSYIIVDILIWWGIRGLINDFRKTKLKLAPIAYFSLYRGSITHLPTAYMWSPHIVPKPHDWGSLVDVVGYCFLDLGSNFHPPEEVSRWIQNGTPPLYIGFGSMPLEDAKKTTDIILEALKNTRQRGILDQGWGDLGKLAKVPDDVFLLEDCPHDWLFPQCSAVIHHGGAGTTATGLRAGCPTFIVPFFGDQFFWGERIHQEGLGPAPIPISQLSVETLSDAIRFMLQPEVKSRADEIAKQIENEDGAGAAVDAFHRHLPSELQSPKSVPQEEEPPTRLQRAFSQVGKLCCLCGS